ncbi:MAG: type VI secretion system tip protein VgrG [Crocinitomicaceae bacterium]|nr:type VI secretion system tip protein VgrG [Crocinitomicaceae bacterium]
MAQDNLHTSVEVELDDSFVVSPITQISISQRVNWHHSFEVKASLESMEGQNQNNLSKTQAFIGKSIKIALKDQRGDEQFNLFKGIITEVSLSRYGGAAADVVIRGYSPTILLDGGPHCASFLDKTLKQIVSDIAGAYPVNFLKTSVKPSPDPKLSFVTQYNESAYNFLGRMANAYGQWFFYNGTELTFGSLPASDTIKLNFGHDLSTFSSSMRVVPLKFEATAHDYIQSEFLSASSANINVNGLDNWGKKAVDSSDSLYSTSQVYHAGQFVQDKGQLDAVSKSRKSALAAELVVFNGISDNPRLSVGAKIQVSGASIASRGENTTDYGTYTITTVNHYLDGLGGYQNRFEAIPSTLTVPPMNTQVKDPVCESQSAMVVDNKDPEGYGRIKINFPWQKSGDTSQWVRLANPYAGKDRGFYILPEIGDEVIVGFEHNNPSFPFIIGSYFNGKANSSDKKDDDNYNKAIRTASGNEILIVDKSGEEAIHIFTKEKKNELLITMKDDGLIRIVSNKMIMVQAKEDIEVKSKNMKFSAEEVIEMKAKEFKLSAQKLVQIESSQDFKMKGLDVSTEASKALKMSANAGAELKSNTTMEISGNAKTTVKATGQLELTAAAQASLKGGIVMIN